MRDRLNTLTVLNWMGLARTGVGGDELTFRGQGYLLANQRCWITQNPATGEQYLMLAPQCGGRVV